MYDLDLKYEGFSETGLVELITGILCMSSVGDRVTC